MAKDPEHRFRSARSFARELRQWLDDNPTSADGEKTVPAADTPKRRPGVAASVAIAAAAAAIIGGLATWAILARPSSAPASATVLPEPRSQTPALDAAQQPPVVAPANANAGPAAAEQAPAAVALPAAPAVAVVPAAVVEGAHPAAAVTGHAPAVGVATLTTPKPGATTLAATMATAPPRETPKERRAREAHERAAREGDANLAAAARLSPPPTGTVKIAISPWGLVEVDGTSSGAAPPITELTLAEGKHQIVIRNGDYPAYTAQIQVTAGQTVSLRYKFGS
jgi:serine/threonine-protein kinase